MFRNHMWPCAELSHNVKQVAIIANMQSHVGACGGTLVASIACMQSHVGSCGSCGVMCRHPGGKQLEAKELISLESLLLAGQKKAPKIYALAVHPLQPHIIAVGANAGLVQPLTMKINQFFKQEASSSTGGLMNISASLSFRSTE